MIRKFTHQSTEDENKLQYCAKSRQYFVFVQFVSDLNDKTNWRRKKNCRTKDTLFRLRQSRQFAFISKCLSSSEWERSENCCAHAIFEQINYDVQCFHEQILREFNFKWNFYGNTFSKQSGFIFNFYFA